MVLIYSEAFLDLGNVYNYFGRSVTFMNIVLFYYCDVTVYQQRFNKRAQDFKPTNKMF